MLIVTSLIILLSLCLRLGDLSSTQLVMLMIHLSRTSQILVSPPSFERTLNSTCLLAILDERFVDRNRNDNVGGGAYATPSADRIVPTLLLLSLLLIRGTEPAKERGRRS